MSRALDAISLVVDENLMGLGRALSHLRRDIALVGDGILAGLLPKGILDSEWIPIVGDRGWVMITNDQRLRTRPTEATMAARAGLKVIHLHGKVGHQRPWDQAVRLLSRWDGIDRVATNQPTGPWWLSVRADRVRTMSFAPGQVERR